MAKEKMTQAQALKWIAEDCDLSKKEVAAVLESVMNMLQHQLGRGGPGEQIIPILKMKAKIKKVPAKKARRGLNPFTKQMQDFPAKKAKKTLKILGMKGAKDILT